MPIRVYANVDGAFSSQWLRLLHYQKKGDGYVSLIEKGNFFLTDNGRKDPKAEYDEALRVFSEKGNLKKCDFPARFMVLLENGKVSGNLEECKEYQKYLSDVQPNGVTLLFTDAYMNNPSSMFGHTLFRIDTKRKGTQLLAHGANFGADTGDDRGAFYALKGLWGGYYGHFGLHPYYDVINLYNNIENRDIWEYQLNFSDDELALFTAHMWEMKDAQIRYYFASKNCSYVLLLMLEAIKPDLVLSDDFSFYTVPLETLKAVHRVPNFVKAVNYRPSRQSKLKYRVSQMNSQQMAVLKNIVKNNDNDLSTLSDEEKADVLETAYQYIQYRYVEKSLELKEYRKRSFEILRARSQSVQQKQFFGELKEGRNPVFSHDAHQFGTIFGVRRGEAFQEISFKPVYTTLLDDHYGLLEGAEINLLDFHFRHYDRQNKYLLKNLNLVKIKSLSEANFMFSPYSFEIDAAIRQIFNPKAEDSFATGYLSCGLGKTYRLLPNTFFYSLGMFETMYSGRIENNGSLGIGLKEGVYYNYDKFRFDFSFEQKFATNYVARGQVYQMEVGYGLNRNTVLYGSYRFFNSKYNDDEEISLGVRFNF